MTVIPIDDFSPIAKGDTGAPFIPHFINKYTAKPVDIIGCTISMKMQNIDDPTDVKTCIGPWTVLDATNGIASYAYQDSDVDTVGTWYMHILIKKAGKPVHADKKHLVIEAAP